MPSRSSTCCRDATGVRDAAGTSDAAGVRPLAFVTPPVPITVTPPELATLPAFVTPPVPVAPSVSVPPDVAPLVSDPLVPPVPASEDKLPSGVVEAFRARPEEWHAGNSIATLMAHRNDPRMLPTPRWCSRCMSSPSVRGTRDQSTSHSSGPGSSRRRHLERRRPDAISQRVRLRGLRDLVLIRWHRAKASTIDTRSRGYR
jgi:hypothetical protein